MEEAVFEFWKLLINKPLMVFKNVLLQKAICPKMTKIEYHTMKMRRMIANQAVHQSAGTILEIVEIFHSIFVFRPSDVSLYDH